MRPYLGIEYSVRAPWPFDRFNSQTNHVPSIMSSPSYNLVSQDPANPTIVLGWLKDCRIRCLGTGTETQDL